MSTRFLALLSLFAVFALGAAMPAAADDSDGVHRFATLPKPGPGFPEGIAADWRGRIFVATFDFTTTNVIYIFDRNGRLDETISLPGAVPLGLEFDRHGNLWVANFGGGNILKLTPPFNSGSMPQTFPITGCAGPSAGECGLNAITFDSNGLLYVSDSFGGRIFTLNTSTGASGLFAADELLKPAPAPHGFPGFGANGLAFDAKGQFLYVANTADDRILKVSVALPRTVAPFAESINGADGIAFDSKGRLWVAANQADEVVALNSRGRVVERVGSFQGVGKDGAARGLLFPASIVLSRGDIYVTNLALPLTADRIGDEPEEDVTTYTVSRFRIPH
jgi:DNA-binding beta-propeller fold protein YncE